MRDASKTIILKGSIYERQRPFSRLRSCSWQKAKKQLFCERTKSHEGLSDQVKEKI